jgi:hypothetical protein
VQILTAPGSKAEKGMYNEIDIKKKVANENHKRGDRNGFVVQKLFLKIFLSEPMRSHRGHAVA